MNSIPGFDFEDSTVKATVAFLSGSMGMSLKVMSACHWHVIGTPLLLQSWSHLVSIGFCLNSHVQAAISLAAEKRGAEENDFWISTHSIKRGRTRTSECIRARAEQISKHTRKLVSHKHLSLHLGNSRGCVLSNASFLDQLIFSFATKEAWAVPCDLWVLTSCGSFSWIDALYVNVHSGNVM